MQVWKGAEFILESMTHVVWMPGGAEGKAKTLPEFNSIAKSLETEAESRRNEGDGTERPPMGCWLFGKENLGHWVVERMTTLMNNV